MAATRQCFQAFTLSELLMALALLGLVATFTMPKVLQTTTEQQHKAKFKETIALLEGISYDAYINGQSEETRVQYFFERAHAVKTCNNNAISQGCITTNPATEGAQAAFVLHNGVVVGGLSVNSDYDQFKDTDRWFIDVNGSAGPDVVGEDVLLINAPNFMGTSISPSGCGGRRLLCPSGSPSITLYNSLFR